MAQLPRFLKEFESSFDWKSNEDLKDNVHAKFLKIIEATDQFNFEKFLLSQENESCNVEPSIDFGLRALLPFLKLEKLHKDVSGFSVGTIIGEDKNALVFSKDIALKVYYVKKDQKETIVPWGHLADEFLVGLSGKVSMGVEDEVKEEKTRQFNSSEPRFIQFLSEEGNNEPFLGISIQWGTICGSPWLFGDKEKNIYDETIMKIDNVKDYYEDFASKYEANMRKWGYFLPRLVYNSVKRAIDPMPSFDSAILDLGCGDGLIGQEFYKEGFLNLTGFDFSPPMLAKCKDKNIYEELLQGDLLQTLPFQENQFDFLLCISVTTYIQPSVLEEWIRVIKPGGHLIFSHKSSVSLKWEPDQKRLENEGRWKLVYVTDPPVMFLPLLKEGTTQKPCEERAIIYVYQKI